MPHEPHNVKVTIDRFGVEIQFHCAAPEGAPCRMVCADDCDEFGETGMCGHERIDSSRCGLVTWFVDSGEGVENYHGEQAELRSGPVVLSWNPLGYVEWRYPEVPDAA